MSQDQVALTWLGNATYRVTTPGGKVLILDPWIEGNPVCPTALKRVEHVDMMCITHGHFDHIDDAVRLAGTFQPDTVGVYELCVWLEGKGVKKTVALNKGGTLRVQDVVVTMVSADHTCGILDNGKIIYGGEAVGYVIEFANGLRIYHAGDTTVFTGMQLIGDLYSPDIVLLPIGGVYTMGPREAAYSCRLLRPKMVIPMHYGTLPTMPGTVEEFREHLRGERRLEIIEMKPGETRHF
jgi:L-ascorbate metabolism protein UlaG (beta-lactamase superfamily)